MFSDRMNAYRLLEMRDERGMMVGVDTLLYEGVPCRLVKQWKREKSGVQDAEGGFPGTSSDMTLIAPKSVTLLMGDKVEIFHDGDKMEGVTGDTFKYSMHGETQVRFYKRFV